MENNPIEIIKIDHGNVETLFKEYEGLGDSAHVTKRETADEIMSELTQHAEMEETLCYPSFRELFNKEEDKMVDEAYVEHSGIKKLIEDLKALSPEQPEFDATMKVLIEQVRHHVKEEEDELLPTAEKEIPKDELAAMGDAMIEFKEKAVVV